MIALANASLVVSILITAVAAVAWWGKLVGFVSKEELKAQEADGLYWLPTEWRTVISLAIAAVTGVLWWLS